MAHFHYFSFLIAELEDDHKALLVLCSRYISVFVFWTFTFVFFREKPCSHYVWQWDTISHIWKPQNSQINLCLALLTLFNEEGLPFSFLAPKSIFSKGNSPKAEKITDILLESILAVLLWYCSWTITSDFPIHTIYSKYSMLQLISLICGSNYCSTTYFLMFFQMHCHLR